MALDLKKMEVPLILYLGCIAIGAYFQKPIVGQAGFFLSILLFLMRIDCNFYRGITGASPDSRKIYAASGMIMLYLVFHWIEGSLLDKQIDSVLWLKYFIYFFIIWVIFRGVRVSSEGARDYKVLIYALVIFVYSCLVVNTGNGIDGRRTGFMPTPNNLAQISFCFLLIPETPNGGTKWFKFVLCAGGVVLSGTTGALLALIVVICWDVLESRRNNLGVMLVLASGITAMLTGLFLAGSFDRLVSQINIAGNEMAIILNGGTLDFGAYVADGYGENELSGAWRLMYWIQLLQAWLASGVEAIIFGIGCGASAKLHGLVPHNEYVRLITEQGLIGLLLWGIFIVRILKALAVDKWWKILPVFVFGLTENLVENSLYFWVLLPIGCFYVLERQRLNTVAIQLSRR